MQEHQQRVVDEKTELDEKLVKLSDFLATNPLFNDLDPAEQDRLKRQNDIMLEYSQVLEERIIAF